MYIGGGDVARAREVVWHVISDIYEHYAS